MCSPRDKRGETSREQPSREESGWWGVGGWGGGAWVAGSVGAPGTGECRAGTGHGSLTSGGAGTSSSVLSSGESMGSTGCSAMSGSALVGHRQGGSRGASPAGRKRHRPGAGGVQRGGLRLWKCLSDRTDIQCDKYAYKINDRCFPLPNTRPQSQFLNSTWKVLLEKGLAI